MKFERWIEHDPTTRGHTITVTASSSASRVVTDEMLLRGGELVEAQLDERLRRQVRADIMRGLGITRDIEAVMSEVGETVEALLRQVCDGDTDKADRNVQILASIIENAGRKLTHE